jgi:hypothetical protein
MPVETNPAISKNRYLRQTRQRMRRAIGQIVALERDGGGDLGGVLRQLREQAGASRSAGYLPILRLCEALEYYLVVRGYARALGADERPGAQPLATTLLSVCRVIQLHADAVAKTAAYLSRRGE